MELANDLHQAGLEDNGTLGLMLLSHENCNFRCVYCYEEFKKNRMLPEVVEGVVALVRKRAPQLRSLSIGWFGGEPLLAFDIIEDVAMRLRSICATHGIAYSSQMTTNGYHLDADRAARCIAAGITRYQITLDGPAETHDKLRVLASGGPTSARIVENLQHLRPVFTSPSASTFLPTTLRSCPRLSDGSAASLVMTNAFPLGFARSGDGADQTMNR